MILAGGRGRRLGGRDKPALLVGDRSLLDIAIDAAGDCPIVVVGPARDLPAGVLAATRGPARRWPGGRASPPGSPRCRRSPAGALIAVLAADLPGIDRAHPAPAGSPPSRPAD